MHNTQGILDQQGRRVLSKLIYCLFTPALTFTKLAPVLSGPHLLLWLPLVINMFVSVGVGLVLGVVLVLVVKPPAGLRKHVVVAAALGNAGNLPLVLVAALIRETGGELFAGEVSRRLLQLRGAGGEQYEVPLSCSTALRGSRSIQAATPGNWDGAAPTPILRPLKHASDMVGCCCCR